MCQTFQRRVMGQGRETVCVYRCFLTWTTQVSTRLYSPSSIWFPWCRLDSWVCVELLLCDTNFCCCVCVIHVCLLFRPYSKEILTAHCLAFQLTWKKCESVKDHHKASWLFREWKTCNFAIFSDVTNVTNVKVCMPVVLAELCPCIPLSLTWIIFQGQRSIRQVQEFKVVYTNGALCEIFQLWYRKIVVNIKLPVRRIIKRWTEVHFQPWYNS